MKKAKIITKFASLCEELSEANIMIYHYENKKWWGRKDGCKSKEIDVWDKLSREWCEKRSKIKNEIDQIILSLVKASKKVSSREEDTFNYFQVIPISLMIDMLIIENIKIYDLKHKKNKIGVKKAKAKVELIKKMINDSLKNVFSNGEYKIQSEVRTF